MKANTGRRYRLYPALRQAERLTNWGHTSRAVWNVALAQRQFAWTQRGVTLRAVGQNCQLTEARAELPWLADLPAQSAQQVLRNLDAAYDNWWNPQHPAGSPKFKKRGTHLSVALPGQSVAVRALNHRWGQVRLPKTGEWRRLLSLERRKARRLGWAKRHNAGRYSKRLRRSIIEVSGRNVRRKATLNRAILDNAPGERRRQLAYKTRRFGSELRLVAPAGTSQTCAACGHRDPASRPGCGRVFACTDCGYQAHADANAARNIEALAAGQAVNRTRSHPRVARPSSRMREPLGSVA